MNARSTETILGLLPAIERAGGGEAAPCLRRALAGFPAGPSASSHPAAPDFAGRAFELLPAGASLVLAFRWRASGDPLGCVVRLEPAEGETMAEETLDQILGFAFPSARFDLAAPAAGRPLAQRRDIRPACVPLAPAAARGPRLVGPAAGGEAVLAPASGERSVAIGRALLVLRPCAPAELELRIAPWRLDGRARRGLERLRERIAALRGSPGAVSEQTLDDLSRFAAELLASGRGVAIEASAAFAAEPGALTLDLISQALFGRPQSAQIEALRSRRLGIHRPAGWSIPPLLPCATEITPAGPERISTAGASEAGGLRLGETAAGAPVVLKARDRARHLYVIGATGTGKSSLLLNLLAQDMAAGEGVILIDPHGDLADDAAALVPPERRRELIFADAADADGRFRLDLLAGHGGDPAMERNRVANALIRVLTDVLYAGVPEAFGPMFEIYFRNALLLLMEAGGAEATILDFERVFFDDDFRRSLVARCADRKVREFWARLVPQVSHDEIALNNIAPYIVCKLAQFTGNATMRRILCGPAAPLDFGRIMDEGGILILKAAKGVLGTLDCQLLCALGVIQIAGAAMARAGRERGRRRPARLYFDEFQTCPGVGLSELLAESRKFGLSLVLANQALGQIDGGSRRPDIAQAALANAANLVAFRVGAPDARRLGPWFEPEVEWPALCRQSDFHATARLLQDGRPSPAMTLRAPPPV